MRLAPHTMTSALILSSAVALALLMTATVLVNGDEGQDATCPKIVPGLGGQECASFSAGSTCEVQLPGRAVTLSCGANGAWTVSGSSFCSLVAFVPCTCNPFSRVLECEAAGLDPRQLVPSIGLQELTITGDGSPASNFTIPLRFMYFSPNMQRLNFKGVQSIDFDFDDPNLLASIAASHGGTLFNQLRMRLDGVAAISPTIFGALVEHSVPTSCAQPDNLPNAELGPSFEIVNSPKLFLNQTLGQNAGAAESFPWAALIRSNRLDLSNNGLTSLDFLLQLPEPVSCCLSRFHANHNSLTSLGTGLSRCDLLQDLSFSDNRITALYQDSLNQQPTLTSINLSNNAISTVEVLVFDRSVQRTVQNYNAMPLNMTNNPSTCILTTRDQGYHRASCNCDNGLRDVPACLPLSPITCQSIGTATEATTAATTTAAAAAATTISPVQLCDGNLDCPNGWDEQVCAATLAATTASHCVLYSNLPGDSDPDATCKVTCRSNFTVTISSGRARVLSLDEACQECGPGTAAVVSARGFHGTLNWGDIDFRIQGDHLRLQGVVITDQLQFGGALVNELGCDDEYVVVQGNILGLTPPVRLPEPIPCPSTTKSAQDGGGRGREGFCV